MEKPVFKMAKSITSSNILMVNKNEWSKIHFCWYFGPFPETIFIIKNVYALFTMLVNKTVSVLTLFRMGVFRAAHGWGEGGKGGRPPPFLKYVTYPTMMKLGTVIPYLKKIQKIYESHDTPPELYWLQHFFTGNQQILIYQEIQIYIAFWYIISSSFNFFWVFKGFFNKSGYNVDDIRKNGHPRPS